MSGKNNYSKPVSQSIKTAVAYQDLQGVYVDLLKAQKKHDVIRGFDMSEALTILTDKLNMLRREVVKQVLEERKSNN